MSQWTHDVNLRDCECGAKSCIPARRAGPTLLKYTLEEYRVVCLSCFRKSKRGSYPELAVDNWQRGVAGKKTKLRERRLKMGMSQLELGRLSGVANITISRTEREMTEPSQDTKDRLSLVLGEGIF